MGETRTLDIPPVSETTEIAASTEPLTDENGEIVTEEAVTDENGELVTEAEEDTTSEEE